MHLYRIHFELDHVLQLHIWYMIDHFFTHAGMVDLNFSFCGGLRKCEVEKKNEKTSASTDERTIHTFWPLLGKHMRKKRTHTER